MASNSTFCLCVHINNARQSPVMFMLVRCFLSPFRGCMLSDRSRGLSINMSNRSSNWACIFGGSLLYCFVKSVLKSISIL